MLVNPDCRHDRYKVREKRGRRGTHQTHTVEAHSLKSDSQITTVTHKSHEAKRQNFSPGVNHPSSSSHRNTQAKPRTKAEVKAFEDQCMAKLDSLRAETINSLTLFFIDRAENEPQHSGRLSVVKEIFHSGKTLALLMSQFCAPGMKKTQKIVCDAREKLLPDNKDAYERILDRTKRLLDDIKPEIENRMNFSIA